MHTYRNSHENYHGFVYFTGVHNFGLIDTLSEESPNNGRCFHMRGQCTEMRSVWLHVSGKIQSGGVDGGFDVLVKFDRAYFLNNMLDDNI